MARSVRRHPPQFPFFRLVQSTDHNPSEEPPALPYHVAAATSSVPFASGFKPPIQVLSRKPVAKTIDPVTGLERLTIEEDDDDADKKPRPTADELAEQRKREREKKERDYEERRAKLFGTTTPVETISGTSTPGATTPPLTGEGGGGRGNHRGRGGRGGRGNGRGRGGRGGQRNNNNENYRNERNERAETKDDSQDARRAGNNGSPYRELFDPEAVSRPASTRPQRASGTSSPAQGPESAIRIPRGPPDDTGRGGFAFANRGAREGRQ